MRSVPILSFLLLYLLIGCKDAPEQIPVYLKIAPFEVKEMGGAAWQKLSLGFVYVNGEYLGAYSMNKEFPILASGKSDIVIFPGIYANGALGSPNLYLPLERYQTNLDLVPGNTYTIQPTTQYQSIMKFPWGNEGTFDDGVLAFDDVDGVAATGIQFDTDGAFEGRSARMTVDSTLFINTVASQWVENLPFSGAEEVWLEMHYRCDAPFQLLMEGISPGVAPTTQLVYTFNRKKEWNKIYISLQDVVVASRQKSYRLLFRLTVPVGENGKFEQPDATLQFDNLKIVHF